jgi:hypothetical protein
VGSLAQRNTELGQDQAEDISGLCLPLVTGDKFQGLTSRELGHDGYRDS